MAAPEISRRERKAERTRREIVLAACELVMEHGYERATIARIAERADLATRTVTTRFPTKEAIFFEGLDVALDRVEHHLATATGDVVDRLQAWIDDLVATNEVDDPEVRSARSRAIEADPDLRALFGQHFDRAHVAVANAVAADTDYPADDVAPQMFASATVTMFRVVERLAAEDDPDALPALQRGFALLRGSMQD